MEANGGSKRWKQSVVVVGVERIVGASRGKCFCVCKQVKQSGSNIIKVEASSGSRVAAVVGVERIVGVSRGSQLLTHKHLLPSQPVLENSCALELLSSSRTK